PSRGRSERCAMLVSCGSLPRTLPVHSEGTLPALDCTQLLLPATLRPLLHGARPSGAQYGVSPLAAGFSRTMFGAPPPVWWIRLLCISCEPSPSCTNTAFACPLRSNRMVLLTMRTRPSLRPLRSPPARIACGQLDVCTITLPTISVSSRFRPGDQPDRWV